MAVPKFDVTPEKRATLLAFVKRQLFVTPVLPTRDQYDTSGRTAIATEADSGIGLETSRKLLGLGLSRLIIAVRSQSRGEAARDNLLAGRNAEKHVVEVWPLDLEKRLDILVNNAGVIKKSFGLNEKTGHEQMVQTNYLSLVLLTILLLPVIKQKSTPKAPGRVVIVNSDVIAHARFSERDSPSLLAALDDETNSQDQERYATSKVLGQLFLAELARRVPPSAAVVNAPIKAFKYDKCSEIRLAIMERLYVYQALPQRPSIRLLRLLPSTDSGEVLQGQLFECALEDVYDQAFPYEALSYVWGDPNTRHAIKMNGLDLPITANLHAAFKRLRDKRHERLLWIDALCIDQRSEKEKEHQIQLMYQIYACASCVVVWLGEENDESDQALEDLRIIGRQDKTLDDLPGPGAKVLTTRENNDRIIERVGKLFQRAWFRRIWVLQEVGAARRVQIRCGNAALDGYAFALAASQLHGSFQVWRASQALQRTIQSTAHLIKGSIFRPAYQAAEAPSERVSRFGELVNMFHDREATVAHDRIYALLGMSSDDMRKSGLLPDYRVTRGQLFKRTVEFIISNKISVECRNDKDVVVIKSRCNVLAHVSHISEDSISGNMQTVSVKWSEEVQDTGHDKGGLDGSLTIHAPAIPLQQGDILSILDGATALTIIRLYEDFSVVIAAAITPQEKDWSMFFGCREQFELRVHNLVLVWDWNYHFDSYCHWRDYKCWAECNDWVSAGPTFVAVHHLDVLVRQCELALICLDILGSGDAKERLEVVLSSLDDLLQTKEFQTTARRIVSALLYGVARGLPYVPKSKRSPHALQKYRETGNRMSKLMCWTIKKRCKILPRVIMETGFLDVNSHGPEVMTVAAGCGYLDVVDLLLKEGTEVNRRLIFYDWDLEKLKRSTFPDYWETTALQAAAGSGHLMVVEWLLQEKADVNSGASPDQGTGGTALQAAAGGGHMSIVERLLQEKVDVNAPAGKGDGRTALAAAAEGGHLAVLERLLEAKAEVNKTDGDWKTALEYASRKGHLAIVERLKEAGAI